MLYPLLLFALSVGDTSRVKVAPFLESDRAFDGTWVLEAEYFGLEKFDFKMRDTRRDRRFVAKGGKWRHEYDRSSFEVTMVRTAAMPWNLVDRTINMMHHGGGMMDRSRGIYRLEGDTLTFVFGPWKGPPPTGFEPAPGHHIEVYRRARPPDKKDAGKEKEKSRKGAKPAKPAEK